MSETILPGTLWRESEFQGSLTGACGPNALAMCASWSRQQYVPTLDVYRAMRAERPPLCDANGVSNIGGLRSAATLIGLPLADTRWYAEPWPDWRDFFTRHLSAGRIILLEVANGQALVDSLSGKGENARNLRYHFIACAGRLGNGDWLCLDGDNFAAGNVHQVYPDSVLAAAQPCAALAIGSVVSMSYTKQTNGWYRDDGTGNSIGGGIHDFAAAHNLPPCIAGERTAPNGRDSYAVFGDPTRQRAEDTVVLWDAHNHGATSGWAGHLLMELESIRASQAKALTDAAAQVASLTKQLADAKAAQAAPATTPEATPAPSKADELVAAIKAAIAA